MFSSTERSRDEERRAAPSRPAISVDAFSARAPKGGDGDSRGEEKDTGIRRALAMRDESAWRALGNIFIGFTM